MTRFVAVVLALALAASAHAEVAALGNVDFQSDTDGFHANRVRIGALFPYATYVDHFGVAAQTTHYRQDDWQRDATGVVALWRNQDRVTLAGVNAEAGVVRIADRTRLIGDATWDLRPTPSTGVEFIGAGDLVATRKAIDRGIAYGFLAASVEHTFADRVTAIALGGYQPFTDGNERLHWRARLIWLIAPDYGVNLQLRYRGYESGKSDVDGAYFNPDRYRQWQGAIALRRRLAGWMLTGSLGLGRETINGTDHHPVTVAEARVEGPLTDRVRLALYALYSRSTAYVEAPDYAYRQIGMTVIYPF